MDLQFLDFHGLSDSERCHLTSILQSNANTEALKLPWGPEKNNNISVPATEIPSEVQTPWYNVMPPSYQQIMAMRSEWPASTAVFSIPNGHIPQFVPGVPYRHPEYNLNTEIQEGNYNRQNERRSSRGKSRRDNYNHMLNSTSEIQSGYVGDQGQFQPQIPVMYIYSESPVLPQHSVAGQIYYSPAVYPSTTLPHNDTRYTQSTYPTHHHQPSDNRFVQQSQAISHQLTEEDTRPPTTTSSQEHNGVLNTCTSAKLMYQHTDQNNRKDPQSNTITVNNSETKPRVKKKNTATNGENVTSNGDVSPPVNKMVEQDIKLPVNENPKVMDENESALVNTNNNTEVRQNGEKDKDENISNLQTTVARIASVSKTSEVENNAPTNDKDKATVQTLNESSSVPCVPSSVPVTQGTQPGRSWASVLKNKNESENIKTICTTTTTHINQNGLPQKESANCVAENQNASSNAPSDKILQNNVLENFYDDPNLFIMGEFLLRYKMDKQTVSLLPRGLTNRSNYCYINSILQALLACPLFYNLLTALPHPNNHGKPNKHSTTPLIDNMVRFVREFTPLAETARLRRNDRGACKRKDDTVIESGVALEPSYVYTMLKYTSAAGVFSVEGRQEDAEEFLSCLLNGINDEMLELMKLANNEQNTVVNVENNVNHNHDEEEWKVIGPKNKGSITRCTELERTPLSDIFRGQLRSRVSRAGEQPTDNVQPFFTLQLDIEKADSVKHALEILVGKDALEGMTCSKTKKQIEAWKQVTLEELPAILILHLKWFVYKYNGCSKILKNVEFPIDLKIDGKFLSPNTAKKLTPKQKQYKLFAVTYHDGKETSKGHYVTDAFHVGYGGWVRYDDSSAKGISEYNVLRPTSPRVPYLLYYRRCDTIGNNQINSNK